MLLPLLLPLHATATTAATAAVQLLSLLLLQLLLMQLLQLLLLPLLLLLPPVPLLRLPLPQTVLPKGTDTTVTHIICNASTPLLHVHLQIPGGYFVKHQLSELKYMLAFNSPEVRAWGAGVGIQCRGAHGKPVRGASVGTS